MIGIQHIPEGLPSIGNSGDVPLLKFSTWKNGSYSDGEIIANEGSAGSDGDITVRGSGATGDGTKIILPSTVYLEVANPINYLRSSTEPFTILARTLTQFGNSRVWFWVAANGGVDTKNINEVGTVRDMFIVRGESGLVQNNFDTGNDLHLAMNNFAWRKGTSGDTSMFSCWKNGVSLPSS